MCSIDVFSCVTEGQAKSPWASTARADSHQKWQDRRDFDRLCGNRGRGRRECRMHLCCFQRDSSGDSHKYGQTWHEISEGHRTERSQPFIYLFRSGCPIWRLRLRNQHLLFHGRKSNYSTMPNARATAFLINALMVMPAFVLQISHIFVLLILYNCSLKENSICHASDTPL